MRIHANADPQPWYPQYSMFCVGVVDSGPEPSPDNRTVGTYNMLCFRRGGSWTRAQPGQHPGLCELLVPTVCFASRRGGPWTRAQPGQHPGLCKLWSELGQHSLRGHPVPGLRILPHHPGDSPQCGDTRLLWGRLCQDDQH